MGPNQSTGNLFIQVSGHSSCGASRFCENYKRTRPSSSWCRLFHEQSHDVDVLPSIPYVLCVHGKYLISLGHNQYPKPLHLIPRALKLWDQMIWWKQQINDVILRVMCTVTERSNGHGCAVTHLACLVSEWARSNVPWNRSIDWDHVHPSPRTPKSWNQIWWKLQNNDTIRRLV